MRQFTSYMLILDAPKNARDKRAVIIAKFFAPDEVSAAKVARAYIRTIAAATKDHGVSAVVKERCHLHMHVENDAE